MFEPGTPWDEALAEITEHSLKSIKQVRTPETNVPSDKKSINYFIFLINSETSAKIICDGFKYDFTVVKKGNLSSDSATVICCYHTSNSNRLIKKETHNLSLQQALENTCEILLGTRNCVIENMYLKEDYKIILKVFGNITVTNLHMEGLMPDMEWIQKINSVTNVYIQKLDLTYSGIVQLSLFADSRCIILDSEAHDYVLNLDNTIIILYEWPKSNLLKKLCEKWIEEDRAEHSYVFLDKTEVGKFKKKYGKKLMSIEGARKYESDQEFNIIIPMISEEFQLRVVCSKMNCYITVEKKFDEKSGSQNAITGRQRSHQDSLSSMFGRIGNFKKRVSRYINFHVHRI
ncbi:hypothetical protein GCK72_025334 [Caenorhabditis remanei]|uniref:Uncharacterized protein n=1 Tax=Caenorhabditis remanei TaxID=31234 RepID=A0A6A5G1N4_CAERE|nr:hypothetical protein GCK72_025334 [Caenorhabditis remanei]KAF1748867.1 hypothetical protein GCK72_025334 [Caenorhabditis remanei]